MINIKEVTLRRGNKLLLEQASAAIFAKQKVGLVGVNGCGKTSLFSLLLKKTSPDGGDLYIQPGIKIAYLAQEVPDTEISALQYVMNGDPEPSNLMQQLKIAEENHDGHLIADLHNRLYEIGGYDLESRAAKLLVGLGFSLDEQKKAVNAFSGGWRMRLNLAQVLISRADLLLLDEPTNYLDLDAMVWLERWLQSYDGTLLLISHDRDFLDNVIEKVIYIGNCKLETYAGNYSSFEEQRAERLAQEKSLYNKQQAKIEHLSKYINRFRAKASKARQAQSRIKMLEKMEKVSITQTTSPFSFKFYKPKSCGNPLLSIDDAGVSYGEHRVLSGVNFRLDPQDAIGILGINGAGKSTFMKTLAGILRVEPGTVFFNKGLKVGYFAQHQIEQLDMQASPLAHILRLDPHVREQQVRTFLGGFGFCSDMVLNPITNFSGGEKARLVLAILIWQKPNLLLLDEPTNHLDLEMRAALTYALQDYAGALVLVAHDRYLLKATVDEFYIVDDHKVAKFVGDLDDYQRWLFNARKKQVETCDLPNKAKLENAVATKDVKKTSKTNPKKIHELETAIKRLHIEKEQIASALADPGIYQPENRLKLESHLKQSASTEKKIKDLEEEWFKLQESA
ncbi:MAG: ATP-binding cassette domain-containing protein [Gammaproteobacteria bacterium]|nr:ATP-binding cassette domain-containing protein [Gammaproteobacteria bacterium]